MALAFAAYKLLIESQPEPGYLKQHLSSLRVVSFISIAWLVAQLSRLGWIDRLATALPPVVTVGRQGLTCFVWGTLISIVADTALQVAAPAFHTRTQAVAAALSVDSLTIAAVRRHRHRYHHAQSESADTAAATQNWTIRTPNHCSATRTVDGIVTLLAG